MFDNILSMLVDLCDIQRADVRVDNGSIQDRRVAKYDTVGPSVQCWFEPGHTNYAMNNLVGQQPVAGATVHFQGRTDVQEGDQLKKLSDGSIWLVLDVMDYSSQGFHTYCQVVKKQYAIGT